MTHQNTSKTPPPPTSTPEALDAATGLAESPSGPHENPGYFGKRKGVRRPRWRNGYIEEWDPSRGRYVYQHRLVMERHLDRPLEREEVVHHINHDRLDNRIENLELHQGHISHINKHKSEGTWGWPKGKPRPSQRKPLSICPVCGTMFKSKPRVKTCSQECGQTLRYADKVKPCPVCGTMFKSKPRVKTCSQSCGQRWRHR